MFGYVFHFYRDFLQSFVRYVLWCAVLAFILVSALPLRDVPRTFRCGAIVRQSSRRSARAWPLHLDAYRTVYRRCPAIFSLRIAVDPVHVPIGLLGLSGAFASRLLCRLVDGAIPSAHSRQIFVRDRLCDGGVFRYLSLLGAKDLGQHVPERAAI